MNDLIVYEINNSPDDATMTLYIGPATEENKSKWVAWAKTNPTFKVLKGQKWTPIYRTTLFKDDDSELLDNLADFIEKTIPMIDEEFKNI